MVASWMQKAGGVCLPAALKKQQDDGLPNLTGNGFVVIGQSTSRMRVSELRSY